RPVLVEQLPQYIARTRRLFIVCLDAREGLLASKLPGQFPPECSNDRAVRLRAGISRRNLVADQDDALHRRQLADASVSQDRVDAEQLARRRAAEQVIKGKHRVGLAATEVGLELDDGITLLARETLDGADEQLLQTVRQVSATEELGRLPVFVTAFTDMDLPQISREFCLLIPAARNVLMRRDDLPPWL